MDNRRFHVRTAVVVTLLIYSLTLLAQSKAATYQVDPVHSSVEFKVRHMVSKITGRFTDFSGTVVGDPTKPGGRIGHLHHQGGLS